MRLCVGLHGATLQSSLLSERRQPTHCQETSRNHISVSQSQQLYSWHEGNQTEFFNDDAVFLFFLFFVIFFQDIDSKVLQCCVAVFSCDGHRILNCFESCDVLLLSWMNEVFIPEVQSEDTRSDLNQGERAELSQEKHLVLKPVKTYTCWRLATVSDDKESNQNWLVLPRCWRWFINLPVWSDHLLDRHLQETIRSQPGLWLFLN